MTVSAFSLLSATLKSQYPLCTNAHCIAYGGSNAGSHFKGDNFMWNNFPPYQDNRPGISNLLQCMNKWVTIQLADGTNLHVYVTNANFNLASGFLTHQSYNSLICNGSAIQNSQQAEACKDQWVELVLPNHISLSFYLTHFDDHVIGGSFQSNQLFGLYNLVASVQC
ncbi:hypothetical protein RQP52_26590 [Paenibacillus sp. PFR10]|uniref:Uncharacterized protein n=2 Tax=Paenibacillus TaxID=44249 RepID=A0ABU3RK55_9BACL|nr:hypothetical protein [Paenibacillus sp. PFR10]